MFPSQSVLHKQVVDRMRARAFRKVEVGAIVFMTRSELVERGRPTNQGINDLNIDVRRQFVYADPVATRATANDAREAAKGAIPSMGSGSMAAQLNAIADRLDQEASLNEARAKDKDPSLVQKQVDFSTSFFKFKNSWDDFYQGIIKDTSDEDLSGNEKADSIDNYDSTYRGYVVGFQENGGVLAKPPPPKSDAGDTKLPDVGVGNAINSFPWEKAALFAGGLAALYWFVTRKPAERAEPLMPARLLGPPGHEP